MLPVLHVLPPTVQLKLTSYGTLVWTRFVHRIKKYVLKTLGADTRTQTDGQTGGTQADVLCKVLL
jgi:hypothetical protein